MRLLCTFLLVIAVGCGHSGNTFDRYPTLPATEARAQIEANRDHARRELSSARETCRELHGAHARGEQSLVDCEYGEHMMEVRVYAYTAGDQNLQYYYDLWEEIDELSVSWCRGQRIHGYGALENFRLVGPNGRAKRWC